MFSKILIANRGEIAVRIMQTCREMGITSVAVYSTADQDALHIQRADEAYWIGPPLALESYLNIPAILHAAKESGAEAVHPGYGFLAENAEFALAVREAGLVWIGPAPRVIALLGDKVAAKDLARSAGVPVVPGFVGERSSAGEMVREAERIGFPVMLKAAAGGGGKGMRVVETAREMPAALESAEREAHAAFGDRRIFLERLLPQPRHIEIQVLADNHGNAIHLGERDSSIQRRHQKVIEEAPSPVMTPELRSDMGEAALRIVRASDYTNAGTVEFLFSGDSYYFLEVNTRLQVEHPATEMVTGQDLVHLQIEIAAGLPLELDQLDVTLRGHAIEARLYAEDAGAGFLPATGELDVFRPPEGPGVRNDVGVFAGSVVTPYYDPLLAKLVVHADTRPAAVQRLRAALRRYQALGVTTNLDFLGWLTEQEDFRDGRAGTEFVATRWNGRAEKVLPLEVPVAAAGFDATESQSRDGDPNPWRSTGGWRPSAARHTYVYSYDGNEYRVEMVRESGQTWRIEANGSAHLVEIRRPSGNVVILQEKHRVDTFTVSRLADATAIEYRGVTYRLGRPSLAAARHTGAAPGGASLTAPMPGTVVKLAVALGQRVTAHEPLVVLEAMKMEHVIEAPHSGVVKEILFQPGDLVLAGVPIVRLEQE